MKVILQVVNEAEVVIDKNTYSSIEKGYLLLISFTNGDDEIIAKKIATKIANLRVFHDENGKTNLNLASVNGEILSVSQFTLYADIKKGNRPSFTSCLEPVEAKRLYLFFNEELRKLGIVVKEGVFGADMKVRLVNDGPFTLVINSEDFI